MARQTRNSLEITERDRVRQAWQAEREAFSEEHQKRLALHREWEQEDQERSRSRQKCAQEDEERLHLRQKWEREDEERLHLRQKWKSELSNPDLRRLDERLSQLGTLWTKPQPSTHCHAYGTREYTAQLQPGDIAACEDTPIVVHDRIFVAQTCSSVDLVSAPAFNVGCCI